MDLSDFNFIWKLEGNGEFLVIGIIDNVFLVFQQMGKFKIFFLVIQVKFGVEYFLNFYVSLKNEDGLLKVGIKLVDVQVSFLFYQLFVVEVQFLLVIVDDVVLLLIFIVGNLSVGFDKEIGVLIFYKEGSMELIKEVLCFNFWCFVMDNDMGNGMNKILCLWCDVGCQVKLLFMK